MSIVVTAASGHFGRAVVESLLARGADPASLVATSRRPEALADLVERGVDVRRADYSDPASLRRALEGAEKVLLVSGTEFGQRVAQHTAVIEAAVEAGASLVAYTSAPYAATTSLALAAEHAATEQVLLDAPVAAVLLRNAWYVENYTGQVETYLEHGLVGATGDGRVSVALRREYAEAAATVLLTDGHAGTTYELGGEAVTLAEIAAAVSEATGREVAHHDVTVPELEQVLLGAGLPEPAAQTYADVDRGIAAGELQVPADDLTRLLGRAPLPLRDAVREALSA
ncbi:SDR family oxidoreductase [Nocardioides sp. CFH 31398]|uniref:SDR family oxidoreductase n=1 Tax=Nocardioides sp. CFH 31398 TaxID=2919579 RepID=UPI001F05A59A|nr:SDR family oxidoreductase [Nocardioides sp. CFH 31398]MCH1868490.1 SDR family oxidoreductase [Nocardioides sp. CFH 31398]